MTNLYEVTIGGTRKLLVAADSPGEAIRCAIEREMRAGPGAADNAYAIRRVGDVLVAGGIERA